MPGLQTERTFWYRVETRNTKLTNLALHTKTKEDIKRPAVLATLPIPAVLDMMPAVLATLLPAELDMMPAVLATGLIMIRIGTIIPGVTLIPVTDQTTLILMINEPDLSTQQ